MKQSEIKRELRGRSLSLSIIIPVFNEQTTVRQLVERVAHALNGIAHEIVLVDDGSTDGTSGEIQRIAEDCNDPHPSPLPQAGEGTRDWVFDGAGMTEESAGEEAPPRSNIESGPPQSAGTKTPPLAPPRSTGEGDLVRVLTHPVNRGKGAALRTGFRACRGDIVVIQDADLEYDPRDIPRLIQPILDGKADVVFGSRFHGDAQRVHLFYHRLGNAVLTFLSNLMTNLNLSDMECGYKAFRREVIESFEIKENRFGVEPEMTAKVAKRGWRVFEVPVSYAGRDYSEGKKIGWRDAVRALWCIVRYRFGE